MSDLSDYNQRIIETFRHNGGQVPEWDRLLLLTTTGAKSGKPHTNPLAYLRDGDGFVVAASNGGAPTHPAWYHNLLANPLVTVEVDTETFRARATVADELERERLYAHYAKLMPGIVALRETTARPFPMVVLERLSERREMLGTHG